jgi:hypothetical protein
VPEGGDVIERSRVASHDLPGSVTLTYRDAFRDYQTATSHARDGQVVSSGAASISFPGVIDVGVADNVLERWLRRQWSGREQVAVTIPANAPFLRAGDVVSFPAVGNGRYLVTEVESGLASRISARRIGQGGGGAAASHPLPQPAPAAAPAGPPYAQFLDLPLLKDSGSIEENFRVAVRARPWRSQLVFASPAAEGFDRRAAITRPATLGVLVQSAGPGFEGRVDRGGTIKVRLLEGALSSISRAQLLNGANAAAIRSASGAWEIVQFERASEVEPSVWLLGGLLRGQMGTGDAMASGLPVNAPFVFLDEAVVPAGLRASETGLALNWRVGPSGYDFSTAYYAQQNATGGMRARLPLSPVHLTATREVSGDVRIGWVRRGRVGADDWLAEDIPLGEADERYLVEILDPAANVRRSLAVTVPEWDYGAASIMADFGTSTPAFTIRVRQVSAAVGPGVACSLAVDFS